MRSPCLSRRSPAPPPPLLPPHPQCRPCRSHPPAPLPLPRPPPRTLAVATRVPKPPTLCPSGNSARSTRPRRMPDAAGRRGGENTSKHVQAEVRRHTGRQVCTSMCVSLCCAHDKSGRARLFVWWCVCFVSVRVRSILCPTLYQSVCTCTCAFVCGLLSRGGVSSITRGIIEFTNVK